MHLVFADKRRIKAAAGQQGFTLLEAAISLVVLMVIGLGVASLFTYAVSANANADDRELAMAIAQERMEWLRTIPFTTQTRNVAYAYAEGGLQATDEDGVTDTAVSAGRTLHRCHDYRGSQLGSERQSGRKLGQPLSGSRFQLLRSTETPSIPSPLPLCDPHR